MLLNNDDMANENITFNCQECNHCCQREGVVFLTMEDVPRIMNFLKIDLDTFRKDYCDLTGKYAALKSHPDGGCMFSRTPEGKCPIYDVRPKQCRTYPFWGKEKLDKDWFVNEAKECPGISIKK